MRCIAIGPRGDKPILVGLDGLQYVHIVGVVGGEVWIAGATPEKDGAFSSYEWPSIPIRSEGEVALYVTDSGTATPPSVSEDRSRHDLEMQLVKIAGQIKEFEGRAQQALERGGRRRAARPKESVLHVLRDGDEVCSVAGEHVQFEVNWKPKERLTIAVWALETQDHELAKPQFVSELGDNEHFALRFGS